MIENALFPDPMGEHRKRALELMEAIFGVKKEEPTVRELTLSEAIGLPVKIVKNVKN